VPVVGRCGDPARQLQHLELALQPARHVEHLPLRGLEAVEEPGDGAHAVVDAEVDELLVEELRVGHAAHRIVELQGLVVVRHPLLPRVGEVWPEGEFHGLVVLFALAHELQRVVRHLGEVGHGLAPVGRAEALVVLHAVALLPALRLLELPLLEVGLGEELRLGGLLLRLAAREDLHQGRGEALEEVGPQVQQRRPLRVDEVHHQPRDVVAVEVLVREDEDVLVAQRQEVLLGGVVLAGPEADDLHEVLDLLVVLELILRAAAHVQRLPLQGQDAYVVAADGSDARHSEGLGGVALRDDQRALGLAHLDGVQELRRP